jgi:hypothetical protein
MAWEVEMGCNFLNATITYFRILIIREKIKNGA